MGHCKSYLLNFEFTFKFTNITLEVKLLLTINNHVRIFLGKITFIDLNSSIFILITINKQIIIKIHITCTNIESICFPGLLKNLEGKHNNNYIVK